MTSDEWDWRQAVAVSGEASGASDVGVVALPARQLADAGFDVRSARSLGGRRRVWRVAGDAGEIVLRSAQRGPRGEWLARVLAALSPRFPVPSPRPIFGGNHCVDDGTQRWEAFSFLQGGAIAFETVPSLDAVGAFIARFHIESLAQGTSVGRAPGAPHLASLGEVIDRDGAAITMGSRAGAERLSQLLARFAAQLRDVGYSELPFCVVHGDPTTFNILANGTPPSPSGLIDFELADIEAAAADIAFCLWRSGRPSQAIRELDYCRVEQLVSGYHSARPLTSHEGAAVTVCLVGRGLQMLVKRTRLRVTDVKWIVAELEWIVAHEQELQRAILRSIGEAN